MSATAFAAMPPPGRAIEAQCRQFFSHGCSGAMGRWLPNFDAGGAWRNHATRVDWRDRFVYAHQGPSSLLGNDGPRDGTFFVYGEAGPPKGYAVHDVRHRIAFYEHGCCSWRDTVAAADVPPPPMNVVSRDLRGLSTIRGVRLGQSVADVVKIYGKALLLAVPGHPDVRLLAYTTPGTRNAAGVNTSCDQDRQFFFRSGRLVLISLGNAC